MGRTTTVIQLARLLAPKQRVLIVDLDPQAGCTYLLGGNLLPQEPSVLEVLSGVIDIRQAVRTLDNGLSLLPADWGLGLQLDRLPIYDQEQLLGHRLQRLEPSFDCCLIDTPATKSVLTVMACCAAQDIVLPMEVSAKGWKTLEETLTFGEELKLARLNIGSVLGILPFRDPWIGRRRLRKATEILSAMQTFHDQPLLPGVRAVLAPNGDQDLDPVPYKALIERWLASS